MSSFNFVFDSFEVLTTRSAHKDTDFASLSLQIGNQPMQTQTQAMGNLDKGSYNVGLAFNNVEVNDPNAQIVVALQVINNGNNAIGTIENALGQAAQKIGFGIAVGSGNVWGVIGGLALGGLGTLIGLVTADCDGWVAGDGLKFPCSTLDVLVSALGHYPPSPTTCLGLESPTGCGADSVYTVHWHVEHS